MKKIFFYFIIFFTSCWSEVKINKDIGVIVKYADAYVINLTNETYTTFYDSKPPITIKFKLSKDEKENIIEQYYDLKLNLLPRKSDFTNECEQFPSGEVFLLIKDKTKSQDIKIGSNCKGTFFSKASRVERFIKLIDKTVRPKPEIKNAPKSVSFM